MHKTKITHSFKTFKVLYLSTTSRWVCNKIQLFFPEMGQFIFQTMLASLTKNATCQYRSNIWSALGCTCNIFPVSLGCNAVYCFMASWLFHSPSCMSLTNSYIIGEPIHSVSRRWFSLLFNYLQIDRYSVIIISFH